MMLKMFVSEKISDGIDHSALEGMINLCDNIEPSLDDSGEKENEFEVDEDGKTSTENKISSKN